MLAICFNVHAAPVAVPNGDFSDTANRGTIGGGLIGGSGTQSIGTGPWSGTYFGAAGLLVPPTLNISAGNASISGLLGVNVFGLVNNGGSFHQATSTPWQANRRYTLSADVTAGGVLDVNVLQSGNIGVALARGSNRLASSTDANLVTLSLISGSTYRVKLTYDTGASVSGNIGIHLFSEPGGVLTASLLATTNFANVSLTSQLLDQVPTSVVAVDASPRSGAVGATIAPPLTVQVLDALGDPIAGVSVSFTTPTSGASATVTPNPALTGANGIASVTVVANTIAGSYVIKATVAGVSPPIEFPMTNLPGPASAVNGASGTAQTPVVANPFDHPLEVQVSDAYGNGVPAVTIVFSTPADGAGAVLPAGPVTTDANGIAKITPTANTVAGSYQIKGTAAGVAAPAVFNATNRAGAVASVAASGGAMQSAVVSEPFAAPLSVIASDTYGNPTGNVSVTFTAPASGASASVTRTVHTGSNGLASTSAIANDIAGAYQVKALATGSATPALFSLTNLLHPDIGSVGNSPPLQSTGITGLFSCVLLVQVTRGETPQANLDVEFSAPASGPSATLSDGVDSGSVLRISTDEEGYAWVEATANEIEGDYVVNAQLMYSLAAPIPFSMHNLAAGDPVLANGFDGACIPAVGVLNLDVAE